MILKTEAVVLRTLRFQESSVIVQMYTRHQGMKSFIVKGVRSARGRNKASLYQSMNVLQIIYYQKAGRDLQHISEATTLRQFNSLQTTPVKLALGLLVIEIFYITVREEESNPPLYEFLKNTLEALDDNEERLIQICLHFLLHLTSFLGFFPSNDLQESGGDVYFDIAAGRFMNVAGGGQISAGILSKISRHDRESARKVEITREQKQESIQLLLQYYRAHIEQFREPESLQVFREVFNS